MHDDAAPAEVTAFFRRATAALSADVPPAGVELGLLFAAGLPAAPPPAPTRRTRMFQSLSTVPVKLGLAAVGMTFAMSGLAAANALPSPIQEIAADVGGVIGVDVPVPGDPTTPPTDGTTTPPTDGTTTPPTDGTTTPPTGDPTTPPTDGTTTPPTDGTTTPSADGTTTPPADAAATLPPPANTAQEAAHIHDFDAACGNHGHYVSFVAQNGTEPSCAADVRAAAAPSPTGAAAGGTTTDPTTAAAGTTTATKPSKATKSAKAPKVEKATTKKASTSGASKGKSSGKGR